VGGDGEGEFLEPGRAAQGEGVEHCGEEEEEVRVFTGWW
jgi:hypothetical protein